MRILSVETTGEIASAAVWEDGKIRANELCESKLKHAETIVPAIQRVLENSGLTLRDMDYYAVDVGPGSFTGIRIGVAVVNALAYANGKKVIPVDAFAALAEPLYGTGKPVAALIDARNSNVYGAVVKDDTVLYGPVAEPFTDFAASIPADCAVTGNFPVAGFAFDEQNRLPQAAYLASAAARRTSAAADTAVPVYLRPSQAERMKRRD